MLPLLHFRIYSPRIPSIFLQTPHRHRTLAMLAHDWQRVEKRANVPAYTLFTKPIEKSQLDERDYRLIKLENGLLAVLVHDAKADIAAASLNVAVGHLSDPDDIPGLAHFCEHLLFMGTEQFPKENEYSEYLSKNNGHSNAYTAPANTNYFFRVATSGLPGALTRFSAFFHCPLFAPSCTTREMNAVDSEHSKNHQADPWRVFQLNKYLTKEGHPWSKFGSGNRETLSAAGRTFKVASKLNGNGTKNGIHAAADESVPASPVSSDGSLASSPLPSRIPSPVPSNTSVSSENEPDGGVIGRETRRRLVEWWNKEYCAGRMRLCVVGKEPLDELADMVSTLFTPIKNREQDPLPVIPDHPFGPNEMGTLVSVQTVKAFHAIEISFPLAWQWPLWRYKPAHFIAHFTGHEGPGSLFSYLKNKGWVTSLSSGPQPLARGFEMFKFTIHLTKLGFENYQSVALATFKYISLLQSSAFPKWYQSELVKIARTRFQFSEKQNAESYAVSLSERLGKPVPPESILSEVAVPSDWNSEDGEREVREILEGMRVTKGRAVLMAKKEEHERISKNEHWEHEKWYGTGYRVERWDPSFVEQAEGPNDIPELYLPGPNEFIPANLEVEKRDVLEPAKRPYLIKQTPMGSVWHKKDDQFWLPKASLALELRSPIAGSSPRADTMTRLFADLVNDSLQEFAYDAELAGLVFNSGSHRLGLMITLDGYNDKLPILARRVLETVRNLQVREDRLVVIKEKVKRDWENFFMDQGYRLSDYYTQYMLTHHTWNIAEKLQEVSSVTQEELQRHIDDFLARLSIEMLVTGNMHKDEAISLSEMVENILNASSIPADETAQRALILPEGSNFIWKSHIPNSNDPNSSLTYYLQLGSSTDARLRATSLLLIHMMSEPAFDILRTKEQLGYIVFCSELQLSGASRLGLRLVVQSERNPAYLEQRVEAFLDLMKSKIEDMEPIDFQQFKTGLQQKWTEVVKDLKKERSKFWEHIDSGYLDFLRRYNDSDLLTDITKDDVLDLFVSRVHPLGVKRSKLSVQLQSRKPRPPRISATAANAFEALVRASTTFVETSGWKEELADENPLATHFAKYWQDALSGVDNYEELMMKIPGLMTQYPVDEEVCDVRTAGVTFIENVQDFKATLEVTELPEPLVEWGDLPLAKL
ncbi:Metalloenzyme, LuxS/M16 peptidase-like protein [Suillus clintonianus]|uniref:Metalloenzyme, LuxS/M16 peptidase-like protein n=1 Tax=Suillus clintonianus TaxID=1904413 RepID=UPI001B86E732|nr:Metalloenzyme, LuxS/M16 peptidase-like protein [Suillus clintonianus]KAG2157510.1 Metalloenzyme, LuxS/M16 peptidase-like protein [Suillus clintonianus]